MENNKLDFDKWWKSGMELQAWIKKEKENKENGN